MIRTEDHSEIRFESGFPSIAPLSNKVLCRHSFFGLCKPLLGVAVSSQSLLRKVTMAVIRILEFLTGQIRIWDGVETNL